MKPRTQILLFLCALGVLLATPGCSSTANLDYLTKRPGIGIPEVRKPAKVAVVIPPALTGFAYEWKFGGGGRQYPVGPALTQYALHSATQVFQEVQEYASAAEASGKADFILVPSVSAFDLSACVGASGMRHMLVSVEWVMMDRDNQGPRWLETASGRAAQKNGMSGGRERKLMQAGFDNLTAETVKLLQRAPTAEKIARR